LFLDKLSGKRIIFSYPNTLFKNKKSHHRWLFYEN
jgi:hypothetical protein